MRGDRSAVGRNAEGESRRGYSIDLAGFYALGPDGQLLPGVITSASGINDNLNDLVATPEPSALALFTLGGLVLAGWRLWWKRPTASATDFDS